MEWGGEEKWIMDTCTGTWSFLFLASAMCKIGWKGSIIPFINSYYQTWHFILCMMDVMDIVGTVAVRLLDDFTLWWMYVYIGIYVLYLSIYLYLYIYPDPKKYHIYIRVSTHTHTYSPSTYSIPTMYQVASLPWNELRIPKPYHRDRQSSVPAHNEIHHIWWNHSICE